MITDENYKYISINKTPPLVIVLQASQVGSVCSRWTRGCGCAGEQEQQSGNLQCYFRRKCGEKEKLRDGSGRRGWSERGRVDGERKVRVDIARCSLITRAAELREHRHEHPVDTRGRPMGSRRTVGEDVLDRAHRRLMCFLAIYEPIKRGHSLWASLKTNRGIGGQKFIRHCHNTAAWQHDLININGFLGRASVFFSSARWKVFIPYMSMCSINSS